jgi:hypothetical protein
MKNILYILMEVHGMMKHASNWIKTLSTLAISEKFDGESTNILKIEQNVLMTIIHVSLRVRGIVTYNMYTIGYNSSYPCITIQ